MSRTTIIRPTGMALAFADAVLRTAAITKVDHVRGTGPWVARRVIAKVDDATVREPGWNAHLSHRTYNYLRSTGVMK